MFANPKHNFISPLRSVGTVVSNGKVSQEMVTSAYTNRTPYWGLAEGTFKDTVGVMKRGEIVYQLHDRRALGSFNSCSTDPQYIERENTTLKGLTILNGQGDNTLSNYDFMNTIQILGIVEMSNDMNCNPRLNIISGGIHDVRNNGNQTINVGDSVMVYAPSKDEIHKGAGKSAHADEKAGVVKLWYIPYDPSIHRLQMKQLWECLSDLSACKNYLPAYRHTCHQFMDSTLGTSMVVYTKLMPEIRRRISGPMSERIDDDAELIAHLLAKSGHSQLKNHPGADPVMKKEIIDALFVPFSTNSKNAAQYLFADDGAAAPLTKREKELRKRLNTIQQESTGKAIEAFSRFVMQVRNLIIGQAKSTARPGDDFSLMLTFQ